MFYFIGFLIFVATFATANQAFAVDNPMLVHEAGVALSHTSLRLLGLGFFIGACLSEIIPSPGLTNKTSLRDTILNWMIAGTLCMVLTFLGLMVIAFVRVMLDIGIWSMIFNYFLGTEKKNDSLVFIGTVIGGSLAAINAIIIYFRVSSQERNNALVEKGHVEDRFRFATEKLESKESIALISAFYQFYYLAKHVHIHDFKKNIFDILCNCLHDMNSQRRTHENDMPTRYYQKLLNVLFMPDDILSIEFRTRLRLSKACPFPFIRIDSLLPFAKFNANLQDVCFKNSDLSNAYFARAIFKGVNFEGANLEGADFRYAEFTDTDLTKAKNVRGANFHGAIINGKPISPEELFPSYKKEHGANFMFILITIMSGFVMGMGFWNLPVGAFYGLKAVGAILSAILGMFLGAILNTVLHDCWTFGKRVTFYIKGLWSDEKN